MMQMSMCAGVDPEFSRHDDVWAILHVARGRCSGCRSTDLCDRWLAGNAAGDNGFCPNAQTFRLLERITERIAVSSRSGHYAHAATRTGDARNIARARVGRARAFRLISPIDSAMIYAVL
jgi:hypothetical protein